MRTAARALSLLAVPLIATACASSEKPAASTSLPMPLISSPSVSDTRPSQSGPSCTADNVVVSGAFGVKPKITIPTDCTPPKDLRIKDLSAGSEPTAKAGDHLDANYSLVTWSNSSEVDSSFRPGRTTLPIDNLGAAALIQGWNEGLIGVKQGGRRLLIVPPDKGYGPSSNGPIKGGETLVFVVDAVKVSSMN